MIGFVTSEGWVGYVDLEADEEVRLAGGIERRHEKEEEGCEGAKLERKGRRTAPPVATKYHLPV